MKRGAHREHPVAADRDTGLLTDERMGRRQPPDIRERGSLRFSNHVEEEEFGNREIIQSSRDGRMPTDTVERVAEDQDRADAGIVEGFNPELIARTKKPFVARVPNCEGKITSQVFHARRAPFRISPKD